jgi:alkylglycerol monooxygenase
MTLNYIALAVPAVMLAIGAEFLMAERKGKKVFHFNNSIANLSIGIAERSLNIFFAGFSYKVFNYLYLEYGILTISSQWYNWILLLLLTDFLWYWYHRLGHEVNLFWAFHIVHHQSEDFNYTASVRITTFQAMVRILFWSFLPVAGFPPQMVTVILIVHGGYSFLTHTEMIGNSGWLENIFITPSLHRVHHASNPEYLDKNFGDIFVFWDKLFGTFQKEKEKPKYGLTDPLKSYSFLWQHFHFLLELFYRIFREKNFKDKIRILFGRPDSLDGSERKVLERFFFRNEVNARNFSHRHRLYVLLQISAALILCFILVLLYLNFTTISNAMSIGLILITLINCGAVLEKKSWVFITEYIRFVLVISFVFYLLELPVNISFILLVLIPLCWYSSLKQHYFRLLYLYEK